MNSRLFLITLAALVTSSSSFLLPSAPTPMKGMVLGNRDQVVASTKLYSLAPEGMDPETWEKFRRLCMEEGEEEGKMEIGVELSDTDMIGWIEGMDKMTPEEYKKALNDKVVKALEDQRARGTNGNRATDNYFENLNRRPQGDGRRSGRF